MMSAGLLLPAAFLAGLFGSSHCIGMCGPVVVLLEGQVAAAGRAWTRRLLCNAGRLGTYAAIGAVAGLGGSLVTQAAGLDLGLRLLRVVAGVLVILLGCNLAFGWQVLAVLERSGAGLWRLLSPLTRRVIPVATPLRALAAGLLWGALPCGLVYSAAGMAATSGDAARGALVMLAFWLGTLPALLAAGASAARIAAWRRQGRFRRVAGIVLIALGTASLLFPLLPVGGHAH
jgi:sulfite exporter TauE/SafE